MDAPSSSTSSQSKVEQCAALPITVVENTESSEVKHIVEEKCSQPLVIKNPNTESPQNDYVYNVEDEAKYVANTGFPSNYYDSQEELKHEREEITKAVLNKQISPGRAKLQLWLYRSMRIVMTDGRILIGIFLCTDSDANVILGVCSEFTKDGGDERMLGLVMVPGKLTFYKFFLKDIDSNDFLYFVLTGRHIVSMHLDTRCAANPFQTTT